MSQNRVTLREVGSDERAVGRVPSAAKPETPEGRFFLEFKKVADVYSGDEIPTPLTRAKLRDQLLQAAEKYLVEKLAERVPSRPPVPILPPPRPKR